MLSITGIYNLYKTNLFDYLNKVNAFYSTECSHCVNCSRTARVNVTVVLIH